MAGKVLTESEKLDLLLKGFGTLTQSVTALASRVEAVENTPKAAPKSKAAAQPKAEKAPEFSDAELAPYVAAVKVLADEAFKTRKTDSLKSFAKLGKDNAESVIAAWERGVLYNIAKSSIWTNKGSEGLSDGQIKFVATRILRATRAGEHVPGAEELKINAKAKARKAATA